MLTKWCVQNPNQTNNAFGAFLVGLPFSLSGTRVSMGGSSSLLSSKQHFACDRKRRRPCKSCTEVTPRGGEAELSIFSTFRCSRRKSWTMPPNTERLSRASSSTSRVRRLSGAKKHTKASLMRCIPPRPRERTSGGRCKVSVWIWAMLSGSESESCSSSILLKELQLSSSAKDGAGRRSRARTVPSIPASCWNLGVSSAAAAADVLNKREVSGFFKKACRNFKNQQGGISRGFEAEPQDWPVAHMWLSCHLPLLSQATRQGFSSGLQPLHELVSVDLGWLSAAPPMLRAAPVMGAASRTRRLPGTDSWRTLRAGDACCAWSGAACWRRCGSCAAAVAVWKDWIQSKTTWNSICSRSRILYFFPSIVTNLANLQLKKQGVDEADLALFASCEQGTSVLSSRHLGIGAAGGCNRPQWTILDVHSAWRTPEI